MSRNAVAGVLEDTEPLLEELETIVAKLRVAIRGLDSATLHRAEAPGRWSPAEVIRHLADLELVYAVRIRMAIAESDPLLPALAQTDWMMHLGEIDVEESLSLLGVLRRSTVNLVRRLGPAVLGRGGRHPEFGGLTVEEMLQRIASHDTRHVAQIERTVRLIAPGIDPDAERHEGVVAAHMRDVAPRRRGGRIVHDLWQQARGPAKAMAVEMPAGEAWEGIDHHEPGPEEVFVARGTFVDDGVTYEAGSFIHYPAGTAHAPFSPDGCLLFVFYPEG